MSISLDRMLPRSSSSLPETYPFQGGNEQFPGTAGQRLSPPTRRPLSLLDLAPGEGYLAASITASAGGLLHRRFTLTRDWGLTIAD
jgi:hypothetical protein